MVKPPCTGTASKRVDLLTNAWRAFERAIATDEVTILTNVWRTYDERVASACRIHYPVTYFNYLFGVSRILSLPRIMDVSAFGVIGFS